MCERNTQNKAYCMKQNKIEQQSNEEQTMILLTKMKILQRERETHKQKCIRMHGIHTTNYHNE